MSSKQFYAAALAVGLVACGAPAQKDSSAKGTTNEKAATVTVASASYGGYVWIHGERSTFADSQYPCLNEVTVCLPTDANGVTPAVNDLCPSNDAPYGTWEFEYYLASDPNCSVPLDNVYCKVTAGEQLFPGANATSVECITQNATQTFDVCVYDPATGAGMGTCAAPLPPTTDQIIDADGALSPLAGLGALDPGLVVGAPLRTFPSYGWTGLDWFDLDGNGIWSAGDALHYEDPNTCPGAIRDGIYQAGYDCKVLDPSNKLYDGARVTCDIEGSGCISGLSYFDANGNGYYDGGEDLVLDVNYDGIFD